MEATTAPATAQQSTGSKTIADLLPKAAELYGDQPARQATRTPSGEWKDVTFREVGEIVSEIGRGLIDLGIEPGDRVVAAVQHAPGVDVRRLRHLDRRRRRRPDLPDELARGVRVGRRQLRLRRGRLRGRLAGREDRRGPRQPAEPAAHRRHRPVAATSATRSRSTTCASAAAAATPPSCSPRAEAVTQGRPVHLHLHVGHDRPAEGLRAHARQLPRDRRLGRRARAAPGRRGPDVPLPPARPRVRAAHPARVVRRRRADRVLRRRHEADHPRAQPRSSRPTCRRSRGSSRSSTRWSPRNVDPEQLAKATRGRRQGPRPRGRTAQPIPAELQAAYDQFDEKLVHERPRGVRRAAARGGHRRGADRARRSSSSSGPRACRCSRATA